MSDKKNDKQPDDPGKQRRTRRLSIFLILGTVAIVAIGALAFGTWLSSQYGNQKKLDNLPPPPSLGSGSGATKPR